MVTGGNKGLQGIRRGYKGLQGVTRGYKRLQGITKGYKRIIQGYKELLAVTGCCKSLQTLQGLKNVTGG